MTPTKQAKPVKAWKGWIVAHSELNGLAYKPVYRSRKLAQKVLKVWASVLTEETPGLLRVEIRVIGGKK